MVMVHIEVVSNKKVWSVAAYSEQLAVHTLIGLVLRLTAWYIIHEKWENLHWHYFSSAC